MLIRGKTLSKQKLHQEKPNAECDTCKQKFIFRGWNLDRLKVGEWFYCPSSANCSGKVRLIALLRL